MYTVFSMFARPRTPRVIQALLCVPERHDRAYFPDGIELSHGEIFRKSAPCAIDTVHRDLGMGIAHACCWKKPARFHRLLAGAQSPSASRSSRSTIRPTIALGPRSDI